MRSTTLALALGVSLAFGCGSDGGTAGAPPAGEHEPAAAPADGTAPAEQVAGERSDVGLEGFAAAHAAGAKVLDVRTVGEFESGHVPGAVNLPVGELKPDDPRLASFSKDEPLYVICESGGRSARAADVLAAAGWKAVNVEGGTRAWRNAGKPVE